MANTLKFGNGEWYGKKDTILAYNDENSNYKPLPFDFSRASKATVINKDGLIEEVGSGQPRIDYLGNTQGALKLEPQRTNVITYSSDFPNSYWTKSGATIQGDPSTAGSELVTNGDFATDSNWVKGTGWTISGGTANCDGTNFATISQSKTLVVGKTYKYSFTISNQTQGGVRFFVGNSVGVTHSVNGTFTGYITYSSGSSILLQARDSFIGSIDNVSVKEVQGFTSTDGTTNAYKLVEDTSNSTHSVNHTSVSSNIYTISVFAKYDGRILQLASTSTGGHYANFDLLNGVIGDSGATTTNVTITEISNGWYRCSMTTTTNMNTAIINTVQSVTSAYQETYQGDGTSGVYIYGAQAEQGSYATSYIPTQGSAVTRLADVCNNGGNEQVINSEQGCFYFEGNVFKGDDTINLISITDGSINNYIYLNFQTNTNQEKVRYTVSGSTQINYNFPSSETMYANSKYAISYKTNEIKVYRNGVEIITDTNAVMLSPNTLNKIQFSFNNTDYFKGYIKDLKLYNTALTDNELAALTQV